MAGTTIIVGYDGFERSQDALVLGRRLAGAVGARLVLADVYPEDRVASRADAGAHGDPLREEAERVLAGSDAPDSVERRAVPAQSAARGLHVLAEHEGAVLIVIGSSRRGTPGLVESGSLSQRLIHGAPCGVAVAPVGYAERTVLAWERILVGYVATEEGEAALRAGVTLAEATGAALRIVTVVEPIPVAVGITPEAIEYVRAADRSALDAAAATVPSHVRVEVELLDGDPGVVLRERAADVDLVVVGSRGYGRLRQVLLGSVSAALLHGSPAPVIVLPRGAQRQLTAHAAAFTRAAANPAP
jgi:nucleotide-binding universal stress UspA family protein